MHHLLTPIQSAILHLTVHYATRLDDRAIQLGSTTGLNDWTPQELKGKGIMVSILHPGFNKTEMTKKYEHIW